VETNRLFKQAQKGDVCVFVTYGFAEFFTKPFDFGAAAGASRVRHVKLDDMIGLLEKALPIINNHPLNDWLTALQTEQHKRRAMHDVLVAFAKFRRAYLGIAGDVDFTPTHVGFNAPEIAFPAFAHLLEEWRASRHCQKYGRLSIYPVERQSLPADSILNWWELWRHFPPLTVGGILPADGDLYFEVNDDFNVHLKLGHASDELAQAVRNEVARRLGSAPKPPALIASRPEFYKRVVYAVWEWDIDLPAIIYKDNNAAVEALGNLFDAVMPRLT
jgi:hypothetical protein